MSDLSSVERLKFEALLGMESGYVLDFSNNTFSTFTIENVGIDIFNNKYEYGSSSKANRLRKFLMDESNGVVGKLLSALLDYWVAKKQIKGEELSSKEETLYDDCQKIVNRLSQGSINQTQENISSPSQKGRIFISYRRIDTSYAAGRIYDRLVERFGEDAIFMDVDAIEGGVDFVKVLEDAVQSCDVLIALIGRQWLGVKDQGGNRRLDNPEDFVRIEIATALKRNIRVIPVLVDGVDMPQSNELPENLKDLARRNALQVNHHSFNPDVYRLIEHSESALDEAEVSRVMKAQAVQAAREKAAKEKAEREAAEKAARKKAERETAEKSEESKSKSEKEENQILKDEHPEFEDMPPPPDKFPDGWDTEWQSSFEDSEEKSEIPQKETAEATDIKIAKPSIKKKRTIRKPNTAIIVALIGFALTIIAWFLSSSLIEKRFSSAPVVTESVTATFTLTSQSLTPSQTLKPNQPSETPTITITPPETLTSTTMSLPTEITDAKGVEMVLIPAGEFIMGSDNKSAWQALPARMVYLDNYYIDKYEISNVFYSACVKAGACDPLQKTGQFYSDFDNSPVTYITWFQAKDYCEWRDVQLPTEAQWEKAARGEDELSYPWGNEYDYCGCCKGNYDSCSTGVFPIYSFEDGVSPYGVFNMYGNASEWVADWFADNYDDNMSLVNPLGPSTGLSRVVRGGSYTIGGPYFELSTRQWHEPQLGYKDVGFRCASNVTP